ncbi:hypothetical protein [Thalassobellus suaedae]|uniref:Uncharacterized protein n=1 Tax=Thalassobellus suaedae TaxID=3074124 RepID=A0ABY9Y2Q8_9FLAO|nr:hypothetical protein RHP49_16740 [Flavobacteriaceae bacterium HL-DH10]
MRKLSYIVLGIIIGALSTYYFCPKQIGEDPVKIVKPNGLITPSEARALSANWTKTRKKAVDSAAGKVDDRSVLWSIDDIQNYLNYAKSQSDSLGYNMTAIRIYLGVYPEDINPNKKDYTTMFIAPIGEKIKDSNNQGTLKVNQEIIPVSPLNEGTGGQAGYPN